MASETLAALQDENKRLHAELRSLSAEQDQEMVTIADYLLTRLEQLGVRSIFGVPGDFNLGFLDFVEDHRAINWVGNCNELNSAYAADGYARTKEHSVGALVTTFGVGELSAINGIAGAFSEMVPVVHIVGVPSTSMQKAKPMIHHTLGDARYDAYIKCAQQITYSQAALTTAHDAARKIDRLLVDCITKARPVYLTIPTDLVHAKVSGGCLRTPLTRETPPNNSDVEAYVLDLIEKLFDQAKGDVVVLVDACAIRHDVRKELNDFLKKTGFPVYAAPMGKTAVDEDYERYGGIYLGSVSRPEVKTNVESAKLILSVGALKSDFNTGNFSYDIPTNRTIELHSDHTSVQFAEFPGIGMKHLFPKLTKRLQRFRETAIKLSVPQFVSVMPQETTETITHAWFWPRISKFFRPNDVIVTETGTANFGIADVPLPPGSVLLNQVLWGSIGWSVGAALGAALASKELQRGRTILIVGDGSLQLTVQEISAMIRSDLKPIIFVLNNGGYTIERYIHGQNRKYNDISEWNCVGLFKVFGDPTGKQSQAYQTRDKKSLSKLLDDEAFQRGDHIQLVDVVLDKLDAPRALKAQTELTGKANSYEPVQSKVEKAAGKA